MHRNMCLSMFSYCDFFRSTVINWKCLTIKKNLFSRQGKIFGEGRSKLSLSGKNTWFSSIFNGRSYVHQNKPKVSDRHWVQFYFCLSSALSFNRNFFWPFNAEKINKYDFKKTALVLKNDSLAVIKWLLSCKKMTALVLFEWLLWCKKMTALVLFEWLLSC